MLRFLRQAVCAALLLAASAFAMALFLPRAEAFAAEELYELDPALSLVGNCDTTTVDPVPDPGCPGGSHPPSGHFKRPAGVAIDAYGDEYVAVQGNDTGTEGRIDIFDDEGRFISELADPHGPRSVAVDNKGTLYVYERLQSGDSEVVRYYPSKYDPGVGAIDYDTTTRVVLATGENLMASVAIDSSTNRLVAMMSPRVQEYASVEELLSPDEPNPLLHSFTDSRFQSPVYVAVDAQRRRLFVSSCKHEAVECGALVYKADFPYEFVEEIDGSDTPGGSFASGQALLSIAVDEATGHIFIEDVVAQAHRIVEFGSNFEYISTIEKPYLQTPLLTQPLSQIAVSNSILNPAAANLHYLFAPLSATSASQAPEVFAFAPSTICAPEFMGTAAASHLSETEGEVQATINPCFADTKYVISVEQEGSGEGTVVGEGTIPGESLPSQVTATLTNLHPGSSYQFSIIATNEKGTVETEGFFATYADAPISVGACANEDLRVGASSALPDCRAFELVTPPDTNGRPVRGGGYVSYPFASPKASQNGNAITFMTEGGALPGTNGTGSFDGDRYRAARSASGWATAQFGPTGTEAETPQSLSTSPDQGFGFWIAEGEGTAVIGGFPNRTTYLQYPDGHSELVGVGSLGVDPRAQGELITENATHMIFQTRTANGHSSVQLEPKAPPEGTAAVYDRTPDGITHVVSLLPPDDATPLAGENAFYVGASRDGEGVAFEIGNTLYLRSNNAATYKIGENVIFAGVAEGGHRIFYMEGGDLLAFDTDRNETIEFTKTGNAAVVNVAPSGGRAYFVSTTAISGAGENPNHARAKAGQQNLYLSEEGQVHFVGIVTKRDVEGEVMATEGLVDGLGLWVTAADGGNIPARDPSRVNPSGSVLLFQSRADLDGYESRGLPQIYRYDSEGNHLDCISCNPTGVAERGGASLETFGVVATSPPPIGSKILIQNLRSDGRRAVFQSNEALVSTDNDAVQDVYEWEESGVGSCTRAEGCLYLISSGHAASDNYLYGMSATADDVFFVTNDILVDGDNDTPSVYDARVGGGFPTPAENVCFGEGCRPGMTAAPALTAPGSPARGAHDNVSRRKCPKGKRRAKRHHGKVRCMSRRHKHHRHHTRRPAGEKKGAAR